MNNRINTVLENLSKSTFRNKFHLKEKEINYIKEKGIDKIQEHTKDFINKRLAQAVIQNIGSTNLGSHCHSAISPSMWVVSQWWWRIFQIAVKISELYSAKLVSEEPLFLVFGKIPSISTNTCLI